jgi:hypothetical protein
MPRSPRTSHGRTARPDGFFLFLGGWALRKGRQCDSRAKQSQQRFDLASGSVNRYLTPMKFSAFCLIGLGTVALLLCSCGTLPRQEGLLEEAVPDSKISSRKLRAMITEYVPSYAHKIESTADLILAQSQDPAIRQNALLWKINAISAGFGAASRPDPLASYVDLWVLTRQMGDMFNSHATQPYFGPWQAEAIASCRELDHRLLEINDILGSHLNYVPKFVDKTASQYPMSDLYFQRAPLATQNIEKLAEPNREILHVLTSMQDDVKDMQRLSALYAEFIPKQARWQAELLALTVHQTPVMKSALEELGLASQSMSQLAFSAGQLQGTVDREFQRLPSLVDQQRRLATVDLERVQSSTIAELRLEREAVIQAIHEEQLAVSEWVKATANSTADRADVIVQKGIYQSEDVAERMLDRMTLYGCTLLAAAVVLGLLFVLWFRLVTRPARLAGAVRPRPSEELGVFTQELGSDGYRRVA